jgi:hypothetical protein
MQKKEDVKRMYLFSNFPSLFITSEANYDDSFVITNRINKADFIINTFLDLFTYSNFISLLHFNC